MISIDTFRDQLCDLVEKKFPDVEFKINERRSSIFEIRIFFTPEVLMESYLNGITGKRSFALVKSGKRIWGCDNYRYWHYHPFSNPETHVQCNEPSLEKIVHEVQTVLTKIECLNMDIGK